MDMPNVPELLTLQQAAEIMQVHPNTLRNWTNRGDIEAVRIGRRRDRRFLKSSILAICQGQMQTAH